MTKEESYRRDIDPFVQQSHCKGVSEAMEGDVLFNPGSLYQPGHFLVQDAYGQGREDQPSLLERPEALKQGKSDQKPVP